MEISNINTDKENTNIKLTIVKRNQPQTNPDSYRNKPQTN
jgi:hypothetical protein